MQKNTIFIDGERWHWTRPFNDEALDISTPDGSPSFRFYFKASPFLTPKVVELAIKMFQAGCRHKTSQFRSLLGFTPR